MKINIKGTPKEIADLVSLLQNRLEVDTVVNTISASIKDAIDTAAVDVG